MTFVLQTCFRYASAFVSLKSKALTYQVSRGTLSLEQKALIYGLLSYGGDSEPCIYINKTDYFYLLDSMVATNVRHTDRCV